MVVGIALWQLLAGHVSHFILPAPSAVLERFSDPVWLKRLWSALTGSFIQLGIGFALTMVSLWLVPVVAGAIGWRFTFLVLVPGPVIGILAMLVLRRLPEAERIAQGRR